MTLWLWLDDLLPTRFHIESILFPMQCPAAFRSSPEPTPSTPPTPPKAKTLYSRPRIVAYGQAGTNPQLKGRIFVATANCAQGIRTWGGLVVVVEGLSGGGRREE